MTSALWQNVAESDAAIHLPLTEDWFEEFLRSDLCQTAIRFLKKVDKMVLIAEDPKWEETDYPSPSGVYLSGSGLVQHVQSFYDHGQEDRKERSITINKALELLSVWQSRGTKEEFLAVLEVIATHFVRESTRTKAAAHTSRALGAVTERSR